MLLLEFLHKRKNPLETKVYRHAFILYAANCLSIACITTIISMGIAPYFKRVICTLSSDSVSENLRMRFSWRIPDKFQHDNVIVFYNLRVYNQISYPIKSKKAPQWTGIIGTGELDHDSSKDIVIPIQDLTVDKFKNTIDHLKKEYKTKPLHPSALREKGIIDGIPYELRYLGTETHFRYFRSADDFQYTRNATENSNLIYSIQGTDGDPFANTDLKMLGEAYGFYDGKTSSLFEPLTSFANLSLRDLNYWSLFIYFTYHFFFLCIIFLLSARVSFNIVWKTIGGKFPLS